MSARDVTSCPVCQGLMGAGAGMCGPCWALLTAEQQIKANWSRKNMRDAVAFLQRTRRVRR